MAKRKYENKYCSVTQLLSKLTNYGLEHWFKITPYQEILDACNKGKIIGQQLHDLIQNHIELEVAQIDTDYPDELTIAVKSFMLFKDEHPHIELKKAELQMTSEQYKLNGTLDCLGKKENKIIVLDWKSAKVGEKEKPEIYISYLYQVSAYVKMYNERSEEKAESASIVVLGKDKISYNYKEIPMKCLDDMFNNVIMPLLKIYYYEKENKKELLSL